MPKQIKRGDPETCGPKTSLVLPPQTLDLPKRRRWPCLFFLRGVILQSWRLWKRLCASEVVLLSLLKTLYKLLSEITQGG